MYNFVNSLYIYSYSLLGLLKANWECIFWSFESFIKQKYQIFAGTIFCNVRIFSLSLFYIIIN